MIEVQNFVAGEFVECASRLESLDPSCGQIWASVPDSDVSDVRRAIEAATLAFPEWSATSKERRAELLLRVADLIDERRDQFAEAESRDQGKPVSLARKMDIPRAAHNFRFFATAILHNLEISTSTDAVVNYTTRSPVGVAGVISPWNLPLYLLTFKLAPALACGNTVVAKPSEFTAVTAWMLCDVFKRAGIPDGVVNVVHGTGSKAGEAIVTAPETRVISFTGSTATASNIRLACAKQNKKLSLELGGKNAAIVFDDVDLKECVADCIRSSFLNQGEICLCTSRIFVQENIYDKFLDHFVAETRKLKVGDPRDEDTFIGALVSREHLQKVLAFVENAINFGGNVHCGQGCDELQLPENCRNGYFCAPTIITDMKDSDLVMQEEIFGPVVCITPFKSEAEVIERVNAVRYGLSACVWSRDVERVHGVARALDVGTVWCNCWLLRDLNVPFGGVKDSGIGREGLIDSIDFYTEVKTVCIKLAQRFSARP